MAETKIYKVSRQVNGRPVVQYFTEAAMPEVAQEMFADTTRDQTTTVILSSFETDLTAVNLENFMAAGGFIQGPVELA